MLPFNFPIFSITYLFCDAFWASPDRSSKSRTISCLLISSLNISILGFFSCLTAVLFFSVELVLSVVLVFSPIESKFYACYQVGKACVRSQTSYLECYLYFRFLLLQQGGFFQRCFQLLQGQANRYHQSKNVPLFP